VGEREGRAVGVGLRGGCGSRGVGERPREKGGSGSKDGEREKVGGALVSSTSHTPPSPPPPSPPSPPLPLETTPSPLLTPPVRALLAPFLPSPSAPYKSLLLSAST